jgi:cell wall-associated NlpC family hydrolase
MRDPRKAAVALAALLVCALAACGSSEAPGKAGASAAVAPKTAPSNLVAGSLAPATTGHGAVKEAADPQEASSYPAPNSVQHASAATPVKAGELHIAAGARTEEEVKSELKTLKAIQRSSSTAQLQRLTPVPGGESIGGGGQIPIPASVPEVVQKVIAGANEIADFPYVFGGGHASFVDNAYDCSGSVSYALAAGGLLSSPETSGELESWGAPGPGRYITVYANAGHTYMYVDGVLYDTAGRSGVYASRWQVGGTDNSGYVVRHYPGL